MQVYNVLIIIIIIIIIASRCFYVIDMINHYVDIYRLGAHLMLCNRSWHLPGNPKLVGTLLALYKKRDVWISLRIPCNSYIPLVVGTLWI